MFFLILCQLWRHNLAAPQLCHYPSKLPLPSPALFIAFTPLAIMLIAIKSLITNRFRTYRIDSNLVR